MYTNFIVILIFIKLENSKGVYEISKPKTGFLNYIHSTQGFDPLGGVMKIKIG